MRRIADPSETPVFLFNLVNLLNRMVAMLAVWSAAISHAFGWGWTDTPLDILVYCICLGIVQAVIWTFVYFALGIEIKHPHHSRMVHFFY